MVGLLILVPVPCVFFFLCSFETAKEPVITACGHLYCWSCLYQWLQRKQECPICKGVLREDNVIPLYGRSDNASSSSSSNPRSVSSTSRSAAAPSSSSAGSVSSNSSLLEDEASPLGGEGGAGGEEDTRIPPRPGGQRTAPPLAPARGVEGLRHRFFHYQPNLSNISSFSFTSTAPVASSSSNNIPLSSSHNSNNSHHTNNNDPTPQGAGISPRRVVFPGGGSNFHSNGAHANYNNTGTPPHTTPVDATVLLSEYLPKFLVFFGMLILAMIVLDY